MKKTVYLLLVITQFLTSCHKEERTANEETIQVCFSTELPKRIETRTGTTNLNVNKVVCSVFENGKEINTLREVKTVQKEQAIVFSPHLIKGRTYNIVFWAMKDNNYNVTDMTAITRTKGTIAETDFDAFTESVEIEVTGSKTENIVLKRPFAQLNIGVTEADWKEVENTFNIIPSSTQIKLKGKDTFNALTGIAVGNEKDITYNLTVSGDNLIVENETYKSIAMCYVLPDSNKENKNIKYSIYDKNNNSIRDEILIQNVPVETNYCTNIVGGLLIGTITYNITFKQEFNQEENNKIIE